MEGGPKRLCWKRGMMIGASVSKVLRISSGGGADPINFTVFCKLHDYFMLMAFPRRDFEYHMCGLFVCLQPNRMTLFPALMLSLILGTLYILIEAQSHAQPSLALSTSPSEAAPSQPKVFFASPHHVSPAKSQRCLYRSNTLPWDSPPG